MIKKQRLLTLFLSIIATLILVGLIFIYSASSIFALEKCGSSPFFVKKQFFGLIIGIMGLALFRSIPLQFLKKSSPFFFLGALALTALTLVPGIGVTIHGSHRWLYLKGISFQPSELLKIAMLVYTAYFLEKKEYRLNSFLHGYLPFLCILTATASILMLQPDFGQTVTICTTAGILFFITHMNMRYLMLTIIPVIPLLSLLIYIKPYRFQRILIFLNPWKDPQGAGFQIIQSLIAIGSGHFLGLGISHSKQKFFYLPMQHTDFIFAIIAEETGFLGSLGLITLYAAFLYIGVSLALQLKNTFCTLSVLGFVILTSLQAIINIFVATGLMPTKGIGLPFVSYGNSALICSLCMVGIVINCVYNDTQHAHV